MERSGEVQPASMRHEGFPCLPAAQIEYRAQPEQVGGQMSRQSACLHLTGPRTQIQAGQDSIVDWPEDLSTTAMSFRIMKSFCHSRVAASPDGYMDVG
ncbi:hypothetical protein PG993_007846 [Apiospora rasikravindrae]|uniref:Uncharacterized protein n=1 Tax=Apiospora rasikravindrae TaxID=990691 RepID=A0ABR1SYN2_9PEZI